MKRQHAWLGVVVAATLAACGGPPAALQVHSHAMRDVEAGDSDDPMVRHEKQRRLYGAVTLEERQARLGNYYQVRWHDAAGAGSGPVEVIFEYQQAGTASRVLRKVSRFPSEAETGLAEFEVTGQDFARHGRVLAWRVTLRRGGREVAVRRSYLWR